MRRWLAIGAVVGFAVAVLVISVWGGPEQATPAPTLAPVAPIKAVPLNAVPARPLEAQPMPPQQLPSPAARALGAMGQPMQVEARPGRALDGPADAGTH